MKKGFQLILLLLFFVPFGKAQLIELGKHPRLQAGCQEVVRLLYAWDFEKADSLMQLISPQLKDHPVKPFLRAQQIYWENAPIAVEGEEFTAYLRLVEEAEQKSDALWEWKGETAESIFFRLITNMTMARYYNDIGENLKAGSKVKKVYGLIKDGFKMKDENPEFLFTTGLYNFYREAYPDRYPVYRPFAWFFQSGDRELGLKQLEQAAEQAVYTRPEAMRFLTLIYRKYEENPKKSVHYAQKAHLLFPNNYLLLCEYIEALLINNKGGQVKSPLERLKNYQGKPYYQLTSLVFDGMYHELHLKDLKGALEAYLKAEKMLAQLGLLGETLKSYVFAGLSKCYAQQGNHTKAKHYIKKAKKHDHNGYLAFWGEEG